MPSPTEQPQVSILTPSLNQARWIDACLDSVSAQTYPQIEHVVVDGGSTDGALERLRARAGGALRVLERPGTSQAEALEVAYAASEGEIIGWLNTDDTYLGVDAVHSAVAQFREHPDAGVAYGDGVIADAGGRILRHVSTSARLLGRRGAVSPLVQPAVFFRRSVVGETLMSGEVAVAIDYELWLRLSRTTRFVKVPRALAVDRNYPERKSRTSGEARDRDLAFLADQYGLGTQERGLRGGLRRWRRRLGGLSEMLWLDERYEFAYPAVVDARWRRAFRQVVLPQRWNDVV